MERPPVPCLVGPTGSGKTEVGIHAARRTNGEVICCDAYTIYRGMPILTAAPSPPSDVRHHLLGILGLDETYDASRFLVDCDHAIAQIEARGTQPWIVGGTALYLRCWLKGFGSPVTRDEPYRAQLAARAEAEGPQVLHADLATKDPERASALHPNDHRRIVRALEIIRGTGKPASAQRVEWSGPDRVRARVFALRRSMEDLTARINRRTDLMFAAGLLDEVRALEEGTPLSPAVQKTLGLAEVRAVLAGEISEAEAKKTIRQRTRLYARKQMTFFRSFDALTWIDVGEDDDPALTAEQIVEQVAEPL